MKKTMKLFWLIAATAIVFSCSKESQDVTPTPTKPVEEDNTTTVIPAVDGNVLTSFGVTFEGNPVDPESKVTVDLSNGQTDLEEDDEVLVFVDANNKAIYKYNGEIFELKDGETAVELSNPASVFYPADEFEVSGSNVKFTMPNGVEAVVEAEHTNFGDINPMAGVLTGEAGNYSVELCNVASVLRVVVSADVNIKSVTLDYGSLVYYATGSKYFVDASAKTMTYSYDASDYTNETVELGTPATKADVLFIVPTIGLANGLTVTANLAENHNGRVNTFTVSNGKTDARARKTIYTMNFKAKLFNGGTGTQGDPYLIATAKDFKYIQKFTSEGYSEGGVLVKSASSFLDACYRQTANIDFNGASLNPIGTSNAPFAGVYDAGEYDTTKRTLDYFTISGNDYAGLFGVLKGGTVKNITIGSNGTSISTSVNGKGVGGIAGLIQAGTISGCTNNAIIKCTENTSNSYVGGIVGLVDNTTFNVVINECVNKGAISGNVFIGGIAGSVNAGSYQATLFKCINNASVTANVSNAGGITGALYKGTINLCYGGKASQSSNYPTGGAIVKAPSRAGGLVGIMNNANAWVVNSSSRAFVWTTGGSSDKYKAAAGGLVGYINTNGGHIVNSVHWNMNVSNTGATNADNAKDKIAVGGIVGYIANNKGYVSNCYTQRQGNQLGCYSVSEASMTGLCLANNAKGTWLGQIFGYNAGTIVNCYYPTAFTGVGKNVGTDHSLGVLNDVKNGTATATDVQLHNTTGASSGSPVSGYLWEILEAGKDLTGWSGADDMSWTHYSSVSLQVAIPTVIYNAGSAYYN